MDELPYADDPDLLPERLLDVPEVEGPEWLLELPEAVAEDEEPDLVPLATDELLFFEDDFDEVTEVEEPDLPLPLAPEPLA